MPRRCPRAAPRPVRARRRRRRDGAVRTPRAASASAGARGTRTVRSAPRRSRDRISMTCARPGDLPDDRQTERLCIEAPRRLIVGCDDGDVVDGIEHRRPSRSAEWGPALPSGALWAAMRRARLRHDRRSRGWRRPPACSCASPSPSSAWRRGSPLHPISTPPMPSSGTRTTALRAGRQGQSRRHALAQGYRPRPRHPGRQYRALRPGAACQQCPSLGRARHGQVVAGQGSPRRDRRQAWAPQAGRDPPRGHRQPARADGPDARHALPLHRVLRRSILRCRGYILQVAQGGARGRCRGAARQSHLLRDVEPAPSDAARHDRQ